MRVHHLFFLIYLREFDIALFIRVFRFAFPLIIVISLWLVVHFICFVQQNFQRSNLYSIRVRYYNWFSPFKLLLSLSVWFGTHISLGCLYTDRDRIQSSFWRFWQTGDLLIKHQDLNKGRGYIYITQVLFFAKFLTRLDEPRDSALQITFVLAIDFNIQYEIVDLLFQQEPLFQGQLIFLGLAI